MIRVALDWSCYRPGVGGAQRYMEEIVQRLSHRPDIGFQLLGVESFHSLPKGAEVEVVRRVTPSASWFPDGRLKRLLSQARRWWEQRRQAQAIRRTECPTLFHSPYYTVAPDSTVPMVITVHDLIPEKFGWAEHAGLMPQKRAAIQRAQHFIAVSQCTKNDLMELFSVPGDSIDVVYHGVDTEFFAKSASPAECKGLKLDDAPYLLIVGGRLHHKNFPRFLEVYASSFQKDFRLVLTGHPWTDGERELVKRLGVKSRISLHQKISDVGLRALYQKAAAFVYPSLYEGFGMPPLEAMAAGAPVVSSQAGPLPEVVGGAAETFDPTDSQDMEAAIFRALDAARAEELRSLGRARARTFTWERCADQTAAAYYRALDLPIPSSPEENTVLTSSTKI